MKILIIIFEQFQIFFPFKKITCVTVSSHVYISGNVQLMV